MNQTARIQICLPFIMTRKSFYQCSMQRIDPNRDKIYQSSHKGWKTKPEEYLDAKNGSCELTFGKKA